MKKLFSLTLFTLLSVMFLVAQDKALSSDEILNDAKKIAISEDKDIFLMFHASWCGWCKRMDAAMMDDTCRDYFEKNFVIIHMVVKESPGKKHLENPGANELLASHGGERSGIPFWLIFDKKGDFVADSFMEKDGKKGNIGCPARDDEVAAFIEKLKLAGPISQDEEKKITERFKKNAN